VLWVCETLFNRLCKDITRVRKMPETQTTQPQTPQIITSVIDIGPVYYRQGPAFKRYRQFDVITVKPAGSALFAYAEWFDAGYPYDSGYRRCYIAATNLSEIIVIRIREVDETADPMINIMEYIVYIRGFGWWRFTASDAQRIEPLNRIPDNVEWLELEPDY